MDGARTFLGEVIEDENGELLLVFPPGLIEQLGWEPGDVIDWDVDDNGRVTARKARPDGPIGP